ncbi:MAG TPA: efflux RND transporter permease subunit [Rhizomicrobium sp.]|jgi:HAE1 family hydrophobic/amphiphilic exporter-1|nr:efflux RND transporter permease subunit [Rhizomicrobium sp.]
MNISAVFIRRPVLTTLLMAALVIFGAFGYATLPVSELPNVDFPTISVSASLPGADPETMASAVATPLEAQFSTIAGISSMTSSSTQGSTNITIQFDLDRNIDGAAQDVQSAISTATRRLPQNMPSPPTLRKVNPADSPILFLAMSSDALPLSQVDQYAETLLARQLSTLQGVAQVVVYGAQKYAVRVQADPAALAIRSVGIDQLATAIDAANVNVATGSLNGTARAQLIHANGQLTDAAGFQNQVVAYRNGAAVRMRDVAHVFDGVENDKAASWFNGKRAIVLAVQRQPGSNAIAIVDEVNRVLPQFLKQLPASVNLDTLYDRTRMIRASVDDVERTLVISGILVVLVIFVFLRTARATLIPSLALPIAVIGTFAGMSFFGFNLDNLSLMALTLSVGFVVDDAIVMLENTVRHIEQGEEPRAAAFAASQEIGFTILSMTVSLAAVFIPIIFMGGIVGRLLHEFAVVIVIAIAFSGVVSVTLTPMLCARILKPESHRKHNRFYEWSERAFDRAQGAYERSLRWSLNHRPIIFVVFLGSIAATVFLFAVSPSDFLPAQDSNQLRINTESANGTSFGQMVKYQQQVAKIIQADPNVAAAMSAVGSGGVSAGVNSGRIILRLKEPADRPATSWLGRILGWHPTADQVALELRKKVSQVPGINVYISNPPAINIGGGQSKSQYQYTLQGLDLKVLQDSATQLTNALANDPGLTGVTNDLNLSTPTVMVTINRDRAAALGVTPEKIETALGAAFGGGQVSQIYGSSDQYEVILELLPQFQKDPGSLSRIYVTAGDGVTLVPLTSVVTIGHGTMPLSINHLGQLPAVTISFDLQPGYALSYAQSTIAKAQQRIGLPDTISTSFQGTAQAFQSSTASMNVLLIIAIIVVYIILGVLYESFVHPLTILSGLPSAAVGALLTLLIFHGLNKIGVTSYDTPLTLYAFVGMMMLIGIVKKNAIMMIDFALHRQREEAAAPEQAIFEAAVIRFRPIMMTTMAAMMGTLPIAIGFGAGSEARRPLGLAVAGGLLLSQLLTLYITPVIYTYLDRMADNVKAWRRRRSQASTALTG